MLSNHGIEDDLTMPLSSDVTNDTLDTVTISQGKDLG